MNKRIRELAEQSGCKVMDDGEWYIPSATGLEKIVYTKGIGLEKFAELIVGECVKVCADRGKHHDGLYSAWASDCSERIEKHFGVDQ